MSDTKPATLTSPPPVPRPGTTWGIIGAITAGLAALGVFVFPVLWLAALAGVFVAGCVMMVGGAILNQAAFLIWQQTRQLETAQHSNTLLAYIAERESQRS